jgi:hypothetical protein
MTMAVVTTLGEQSEPDVNLARLVSVPGENTTRSP